MTRFLFWNFRYTGDDKEALLARVVMEEGVDVLAMAESKISGPKLLDHLAGAGRAFSSVPVPNDWIQIYAGFPRGCFPDYVRDQGRLCLRKLKVPGRAEILLGVVHLESGLQAERVERADEINDIARSIREVQRESKVGHTRTVVVGDFNLNPFDDGMIFPRKFGAMMTKDLVRRIGTSAGGRLARFYNPMWRLMGRTEPDEAPGTYYWSAHRDYNTYWTFIDQVLIGSDLLDSFPDDRLRILTSIPDGKGGRRKLLRPTKAHWKVEISDHLPILFDLDLPEEPDHHDH